MLVEKIVKDGITKQGDRMVLLTYEVDETKPVCWREGSGYRFNSQLISTVIAPKKLTP
jgi:hypothetical protein